MLEKIQQRVSGSYSESCQQMRNGMLVDRKQKVLTEESLDDIGTSVEHLPLKPLMRLVQVTGVTKRWGNWDNCYLELILNCLRSRHTTV